MPLNNWLKSGVRLSYLSINTGRENEGVFLTLQQKEDGELLEAPMSSYYILMSIWSSDFANIFCCPRFIMKSLCLIRDWAILCIVVYYIPHVTIAAGFFFTFFPPPSEYLTLNRFLVCGIHALLYTVQYVPTENIRQPCFKGDIALDRVVRLTYTRPSPWSFTQPSSQVMGG